MIFYKYNSLKAGRTNSGILALACFSLAIFIFSVSDVNADAVIKRDPTITCEGVPRWDRFVVNSQDTKWDPEKGGCYFVADSNAPVAPTAAQKSDYPLYGKYGDDANFVTGGDPRALYGTYDENANFAQGYDLYGKFDGNYQSSEQKKTVVVAAAPVAAKKTAPVKKPTPKPIPAKKAASAPEKNPVKTASAKPKAVAVTPAPVVVATPKPKPAPKPAAQDIAAATRGFNIDDYCNEYNLPVKGALPDGLVLMSGAPDKMCCVIK